MKKNRILAVVLASALVLGVLAACTPAAPQTEPVTPQGEAAAPTGPASGTLVIATENETPSIAPARHNAAAASFKNVMTHNGLFRVDTETLEPVPDLIADWRAISDVLFEFTLHSGIYFHNGDYMTAEDVVTSLHYVKNYPDAAIFQRSIVNAEVVDTYTFTIYTETPNAMLFSDLTHQANFIMPASAINTGHDFTVDPIGSGPYVFQEWRFGDALIFSAHPNYFDDARAPRIDEVIWRIIPEGASRTIALEMGEVDYIVEVAAPDIPRLEEDPNVALFMGMGTQHNGLYLNNENPMFANLAVRQALDMAIDKDSIVAVGMDGFAIPVWSQVPVNFAGVSTEGMNSFDPEGARALLAEAGVDPSTISFGIIASNDARVRMAEVIQANLHDIGIDTHVVRMDLATFLDVTTSGDYESAIANFTSSNLLSYMVGMLHGDSVGGSNRNRINHRELTDLIDQAVATVDETARLAVFENATRIANEQTPMVPLFQAMVVRAFSVNLEVPETSATGGLNINMMYWR
ncbi:MAG: ABC transporter substrate-binding protein [Defluviitaleaceae bacterium]|nr:ABC transporter substrate-binding protein [Defluviitaleaceae bacterium]